MPIVFKQDTNQFFLHTDRSTYIIELFDGRIPLHAYWGKTLLDMPALTTWKSSFPSMFLAWDTEKMDDPDFLTTGCLPLEYPVYGSGDMRDPAFHVQFERDGSRITRLEYAGHTITDGKPKLPGLPATYTNDDEAQTLELHLKDALTGLSVYLLYTVIPAYDAIARSVRVVNGGDQNMRLMQVASASVDFYDSQFDMLHLPGMWARERQIERRPLIHGVQRADSKRGASSHYQNPFFALMPSDTTETTGEAFGFNLIYSGDFVASAELDAHEMVRATLGINPYDFSWLLEPNEQFQTPEAVMIYSDQGLGEMSRQFHRLYRNHLLRGKYKRGNRPVLINNWEGTYWDFNEEKLLEIAKGGKDFGCELLVLDDGWFDNDRFDELGPIGDWDIVDKKKLPNGLKGLGDKLNAMGMKFGLWFEPEVYSTNSELYKKHPDWCIHVDGRPRTKWRHTLNLDYSRPEVCEHVIKTISDVLSSAPISYVKWDYNRNISEAGSEGLPPERQQELRHRYMLGLYYVMETLVTRFPDVLFEGCSGGGGRFDCGILHYMPQIWTSDDTDPEERIYIQHGTSMVYPAITMSAHVSASPNHQTYRATPFKLRGDVAMAGQFGYELDPAKMTDEEIEAAKEQVAFYKKYREVVQLGDLYRLVDPFKEPFAAWQYISEDKNTVLLYTFVINIKPYLAPKRVKMQGLEAEAIYVEEATGKEYTGAFLMQVGVARQRTKDHDSEIAVFYKK